MSCMNCGKKAVRWPSTNVIQCYIYSDDAIQVMETRYLLQYLEAAVMSDNQLEGAIASLIKALEEAP